MKKLLIVLGLSILVTSGAGVLFALQLLGVEEPKRWILTVAGSLFVGVGSAALIVRSPWLAQVEITPRRARERRPGLMSAPDFGRAIVGVGDHDAPFSLVAYWLVEDGTIAALYLRPNWPYFPLLIEEGSSSITEALSTELGRGVRLLEQGEFADAIEIKYFGRFAEIPAR